MIHFGNRSKYSMVCLRSTPHPVTVTTRIIAFLVGNPYKPSFATVTGWGVHRRYVRKRTGWELVEWFAFALKMTGGNLTLTLTSSLRCHFFFKNMGILGNQRFFPYVVLMVSNVFHQLSMICKCINSDVLNHKCHRIHGDEFGIFADP